MFVDTPKPQFKNSKLQFSLLQNSVDKYVNHTKDFCIHDYKKYPKVKTQHEWKEEKGSYYKIILCLTFAFLSLWKESSWLKVPFPTKHLDSLFYQQHFCYSQEMLNRVN